MSATITLTLNRLTPWTGNVRRTGASDGIEALAASIHSHGLLQSLVVRPAKKGKYEILAGRRRYLALKSLANAGRIAKDHPIPCTVSDGRIDATELSLAENVLRAPMHPADQFEAFRDLIDGGATITDVAARFGVSDGLIAKRLKLGRLSPNVLAAYRRGEIDLEAAQAFAVTDDHAAQDRVLGELPDWNRSAGLIRQTLTEDDIATTDKRFRFIGLDAYKAAGGTIRHDLFSEDDDGFIENTDLLHRLIDEQLAVVASELRCEGWSWVESTADLDYAALAQFTRRYPEEIDLPEEQQVELDQLTEAFDALCEQDDSEDSPELASIERRIDALNAATEHWPAETLAIGGAIVSLDHRGGLRIERGLVRKSDLPADDEQNSLSRKDTGPSGLSPKLIEELTAHRSAALAAELVAEPRIALVAVAHAMLLSMAYPGCNGDSCLGLSLRPPHLRGCLTAPEACKGLVTIEAHRDRLCEQLPADPAQLWSWCLERSQDELVQIVAVATAMIVSTVQRKNERTPAAGLAHGAALAQSLGLDMTTWFTPTADNFFTRITRSQILAAIDEAKGGHGPALDKLGKAELAAKAETLVAGTGWLPAALRISPPAE